MHVCMYVCYAVNVRMLWYLGVLGYVCMLWYGRAYARSVRHVCMNVCFVMLMYVAHVCAYDMYVYVCVVLKLYVCCETYVSYAMHVCYVMYSMVCCV